MHRHYRWPVAALALIVAGILFALLRPAAGPGDAAPAEAIGAPAAPAASALQVLSAGERSWENHPAIALTFSAALDTNADLARHVQLQDSRGRDIGGAPVPGAGGRVLYLPEVQPEHEYTVRVLPGLKALDGSRLQTAFSASLQIRKVTPALGFASRGSLLPAAISGGLPIMSVNIPEVDVQVLRVRDERLGEFLAKFHDRRPGYQYRRPDLDTRWGLERLAGLTESVWMMRYRTGARPDTRTITQLPIGDIEPLQRDGLYIAVLSEPGDFHGRVRGSLFYVSDLGVHVRAYASAMHVHVNSLATALPVAAAEVLLFDNAGEVRARLRSDADGIARAEAGMLDAVQTIVVRHGQQVSVVALADAALDLSGFSVAGPASRPLSMYLYAERDLYRPGERLNVVGLLRDHDGRATAQLPLHAVLRRPDGQVVRSWILQARGGGAYELVIDIPDQAPTGRWQLQTRATPDSPEPLGSLAFHVEEFLPERMKLTLAGDTAALLPGEALTVAAEGRYLHGAVAAGNRLEAVVRLRDEPAPLPALPGFVFGDAAHDRDTDQRIELPALRMDAAGRATLHYRAPGKAGNIPRRISLVASLFETGGRPVVRELQAVLWPAPAVLALRPDFQGTHHSGQGPVQFELLRVTPAGKRIPGTDLAVSVIREDRDYFWQWDEARGWHADYRSDDIPVWNSTLDVPADQPARFAVPASDGRYRVEVFDAETGLSLTWHFTAGHYRHDSNPAATATRPDKLPLALDRPGYRGGDTARLTVTVPAAGELLVLVEADRLLWSRRLRVPAGEQEVAIPIDPTWDRHDIYVTALALRPGRQQDGFSPNRALGITHLPLAREHRRLAVQVSAPASAQPMSTAMVRVRVGQADAKARVTLAAVDVGALAITGHTGPDPFAHFFARRRYLTDGHDLYNRVIEHLEGVRASQRFGGDAALGRKRLGNTQVEIVSLFSGIVSTDANGEARIPLTLPDFNGRLRLMAVAFSADRFGAASAEMTVAAPLIAEMATPRFLAPGDQSRLTVDLHNNSGRRLAFRLQLTADAPLALTHAPADYDMAAGEHLVLQLPLAAGPAPGEGRIHLRTSGDIALSRSHRLAVRPAWPEARRLFQAQLSPGDSTGLDPALLEDLLTDSALVELRLGNRPPIAVGEAVRGLLAYPYGCLEQTTSRAFPWLLVDADVARRYGLPEHDRASRARRINAAVDRLRGLQKRSGGFGLWHRDSPEQAWLGAYVTDFLLSAGAAGHAVASEMLEPALERLRQGLDGSLPEQHEQGPEADHRRLAARAYAGYVLARHGQVSLGSLRTLHEAHAAGARSGLPLVHLGIALHLAGDSRLGAAAIRAGLALTRAPDTWLGDYGSPLRDQALMYALLVEHDLAGGSRDSLLWALRDSLSQRTWFSTQERMALLRAGLAAGAQPAGPWQALLTLDGRAQVIGDSGLLRLTPPAAAAADLQLRNDSNQPLFLEVAVTGYTRSAPRPGHADLDIERRWLGPTGERLDRADLRPGALVLTELTVTARRALPDALVVDLVPAGLEVENLNIGAGEGLPDIRIDGQRPAQRMQSPRIQHLEYRDDRFVAAVDLPAGSTRLYYLARVVTPGQFSVPPPLVEDMYRPRIRALGAHDASLRIR